MQIVDGNKSSSTSVVNGTGNLVLGYDESPGSQTGSHDLVLGEKQTYKGYSELVGGYGNNVSGSYATALGLSNTASGSYNLVGGDQNTVSGSASSVLGGYKNVVSSAFSTLSGGCSNLVGTGSVSVSSLCSNTASYNHDFASISGGAGNQATGASARSLSGGQFNVAADTYSLVAGGCETSPGPRPRRSVTASTRSRRAPRRCSVAPPTSRTATSRASPEGRATDPGYSAAIAGGSENSAAGAGSSIGGGYQQRGDRGQLPTARSKEGEDNIAAAQRCEHRRRLRQLRRQRQPVVTR